MNVVPARGLLLCAIAVAGLCPVPVWAQAGMPTGDLNMPAKQCLSNEQKELIKKLKTLDRPTRKDDPQLPFDPDFFVGTWDVEWGVPESPFGQAGPINGELTIKYVEGCHYEGDLKAESPDGPYTAKVLIMYNADLRHLTWVETDSRGFTITKTGRLGGDSGGYFTHYWEIPQFRHKDKLIRLKGSAFIGSPVAFRSRYLLSVDDGPFENFGSPWYRRHGAATKPKPKR